MCFEWLGSIRLGDYAALRKRKHSQPYSRSSHNIRKANYKIPQDSKAGLLCARKKEALFVLPDGPAACSGRDAPGHSGASEMLRGEKLLEGSGPSPHPLSSCHVPRAASATASYGSGWHLQQTSFLAAARPWVETGENKWLTKLQKIQGLQKKNQKTNNPNQNQNQSNLNSSPTASVSLQL